MGMLVALSVGDKKNWWYSRLSVQLWVA